VILFGCLVTLRLTPSCWRGDGWADDFAEVIFDDGADALGATVEIDRLLTPISSPK